MEYQTILGQQTHALTSEGHDASEDGTGRGTPLVFSLAASSQVSEVSMLDSRGLGFDTPSSVRAILGAARCSPHGGPESPSTTTYVGLLGNQAHALTSEGADASEDGTGRGTPLIFSVAAPTKYQPLKKLTAPQVLEAIWLYNEGLSLAEVATKFSVSRQAMHDLLKRRIQLRDRIEALPRKQTSAVRAKRAETLKRYRSRAARITRGQIRDIWARDEACRLCGAEGAEIDHIIPVSMGGQTVLSNLQLLCKPCHTEKSRDEMKGVMLTEVTRRSICSAEASRSLAKTSPSPENAEGSPGSAPGCSSSSHESSTLFDPDSFSSRTFRVSSVATAVGTSEQSLERWPTSGTAWAGGFSTAVSSECRSGEDGCSSSEPALTEILQPPHDVPAKYSLSGRAAQGILRRAQKRGRTLPSHLSAALEAVARTTTTPRQAA